jgi:hypothetical protein
VTVDGERLPAMTNGLAFSYKLSGNVQWQVDISNLGMECERYMGTDGRVLRDGEQTVHASTGVAPGVGIDNLSVPHENVEIVGATPSKPGDKLALCVAAATFTGALDAYEDKKIVMNGRLEGMYCGEKKL